MNPSELGRKQLLPDNERQLYGLSKGRLLLLGVIVCLAGCRADEPAYLATDGAWCWFSDPRAVHHDGARAQTFAGWVDSEGNIIVGAYDRQDGRLATHVVHERLEVDDHANPSLLIRPDGRLLVFYSKHAGTHIKMRRSVRPADISAWEPVRSLALNAPEAYEPGLRDRYCYTNPYQLADEKDRIYLFWRGLGNKPNLSHSDDGGVCWSPGRIVIRPRQTYENQRPYLKVASNGKDRLHLAFTDGHPRNEPANGIYYARYQEGAFHRADGTRIAILDDLPFGPGDADLVYDARQTGVRAWIWDVAEGPDGHPVIVYTRLPAETDHRYHYAAFDGQRWHDDEVTQAGAWFPQTPAGDQEREPHYSGGIALDHNDPSVVYLSREIEGVFEVERWTTPDRGQTWATQSLTSGSTYDNVRPVVVRDAPLGRGPYVLWMENLRYVHYTDYQAAIRMAPRP